MSIPCPNAVTCSPCDDPPIVNLSSEALDNIQLTTMVFVPGTPLLGEIIKQSSDYGTGTEPLPQPSSLPKTQPLDTPPDVPPPPSVIDGTPPISITPISNLPNGDPIPVVWNDAQTIQVPCLFGSQTGIYYSTFPAHKVVGRSKAEANAVAQSLGKQTAEDNKACIDKVSFYACYLQSVDEGFQVNTGKPPFTWSFYSGVLPAGLVFTPDPVDSAFANITGFPSENGQGVFVLRVDDNVGGYLLHPVTWHVQGLINSSLLPDTTIGVPYAFALLPEGFTDSWTFSISNGALPDGLHLDPNTGVISGTPTADGTWNFQVLMEANDATDFHCYYNFTINGGGY